MFCTRFVLHSLLPWGCVGGCFREWKRKERSKVKKVMSRICSFAKISGHFAIGLGVRLCSSIIGLGMGGLMKTN